MEAVPSTVNAKRFAFSSVNECVNCGKGRPYFSNARFESSSEAEFLHAPSKHAIAFAKERVYAGSEECDRRERVGKLYHDLEKSINY